MKHMTEAEALEMNSDLGAADDLAYEAEMEFFAKIDKMKEAYRKAKTAETGCTIACPTCGKLILKRVYNKIFCSNGRTRKGRSSCKDVYWNTVDNVRRGRASGFSR